MCECVPKSRKITGHYFTTKRTTTTRVRSGPVFTVLQMVLSRVSGREENSPRNLGCERKTGEIRDGPEASGKNHLTPSQNPTQIRRFGRGSRIVGRENEEA